MQASRPAPSRCCHGGLLGRRGPCFFTDFHWLSSVFFGFRRFSSIFHRFPSIVIDFHRFSLFSHDFHYFFIDFHWFSSIFHRFSLILEGAVTPEVTLTREGLGEARGAVRDPLQEPIPLGQCQYWAQNDSKLTRIHSFLRFLAQKRKSVRNFDKITTTFIVQTAFYWQRYRDLFCINSPTTVPIFGPPRGQIHYFKQPISTPPTFGEIWRTFPTFADPVSTPLHAHLQDYVRRQATPSK